MVSETVLALDNCDGAGLLAFFAVGDVEFDNVAFIEGAISAAADFRIVNEQIGAVVLGDEAVALVTVEPLDFTTSARCHCVTLS